MVTGGLGFVGRHLVTALLAQGHEVVSYNRDFSVSGENVTAVQGELFDFPRLVRTLQQHRIEAIIHTAAMSHPELSIDLPVTTFAANVTGTVSLFEAARMAEVGKVVNFSSEVVYGNLEPGPVDEMSPLRPTTPYGVTKVSNELLADVYGLRYGLHVPSLRIAEIYGPGNPMPAFVKDILIAAVRGVPFRLDYGGDHPFQYVHVDDVVTAAISALSAPAGAYNITGHERVTLREVASLVEEIVPGADIRIDGGFISSLDRQAKWDTSKAQRVLGFQPRWSLKEGLAQYATWLVDHPY